MPRDEIPFDPEAGMVDMKEYERKEKARKADLREYRKQGIRFLDRRKDTISGKPHHFPDVLAGLEGTDGPLPQRRNKPRGR